MWFSLYLSFTWLTWNFVYEEIQLEEATVPCFIRNWGTHNSHGASKPFYSYDIELLSSWWHCVGSVLCKCNWVLKLYWQYGEMKSWKSCLTPGADWSREIQYTDEKTFLHGTKMVKESIQPEISQASVVRDGPGSLE